MIKAKLVSSLEKAFVDQSIDDFSALEHISALKGERLSLQLLYTYDSSDGPAMWEPKRLAVRPIGRLSDFVTLRQVVSVPVAKPTYSMGYDDNYLRTTPGLYPDLLRPLYYNGSASFACDILQSIWIEINIPEQIEPGQYTLSFAFDGAEFGCCDTSVSIEIIDAVLPHEDIYFTQWFHADCLANYLKNIPPRESEITLPSSRNITKN